MMWLRFHGSSRPLAPEPQAHTRLAAARLKGERLPNEEFIFTPTPATARFQHTVTRATMLEPGREISDGTLAALAMDGSFDVGQLLDQDDPLGTISFPDGGELQMAGTSTGSLPGTGLFPDAAPGTAGAITGAVGIGDLKLVIQAHSVHKVENEGTEDREYVVSNLRTFTVEVVLVAKESNSLAPNQLSLQAELLYENGCEVRPTQPDEQVRGVTPRGAQFGAHFGARLSRSLTCDAATSRCSSARPRWSRSRAAASSS